MGEAIEGDILSNCPYCGYQNSHLISVCHGEISKEVVTCDSDQGGCEADYVINVTCEVQVRIFSLGGK